jgi:hypothetical protein
MVVPMLSRLPRRTSWLSIAGVILILVSLVPPAGTCSRRYVFAESLQFALLATAVPALLVLGAPWRGVGLPVSVNALARLPGLAVLEAITLAGAGSALWLELVESPPLLPELPRPLRAVFAALAQHSSDEPFVLLCDRDGPGLVTIRS